MTAMFGIEDKDGTLWADLRSVRLMRAPDPAFADPRLAILYDVLDDDRSDLDAYASIAGEVNAAGVVDIGCGTGSLAVRLAASGLAVVGVDPAGASLDVARMKPLAERVRWVHGDATALAAHGVSADLAVMTGNVAQVFVSDDEWRATLAAVHECLHPGGWFAFETRRPEVRAWEHWDIAPMKRTLPNGTIVVISRTVIDIALPLVTFESKTTIDGEVITSASTLRFRQGPEVERDLAEEGFDVVEVREAPDRPGKELVFLARRPTD